METKQCSCCGQVKPAAEFNKRALSKDGLNSRCRTCVRNLKNEHRTNNRNEYNLYQKQWREKNKDHLKTYRNKRKEKLSKAFKEYYKSNRHWPDMP